MAVRCGVRAAKFFRYQGLCHVPSARRVYVMGIETSCDDTCIAILSAPVVDGRVRLDGVRVVADVSSSQLQVHAAHGGIVPHLAVREHQRELPRLLASALASSALDASASSPPPVLAAVGVTAGPGLAMCLKAGLDFAKGVVATHATRALPPPLLLPVHHLEAHLLVPRLGRSGREQQTQLSFPFLVLLVSGGHSLLAVAHAVGRYTPLASTLDDSLGECFDKVARGLQVWRFPPDESPEERQASRSSRAPYEGAAAAVCGGASAVPAHAAARGHLGAQLEALAAEGDQGSFPLTVPLSNTRGAVPCAFSFSGLKSAIYRLIATAAAAAPSQSTLVQHAPLGANFAGAGADEAAPTAPALARTAALACTVGVSAAGGTGRAPTPTLDLTQRQSVADLAASFQRCVAQHLVDQVARAAAYCELQAALHAEVDGVPWRPITSLVVCGGVASNAFLRGALSDAANSLGIDLHCPPPRMCVDNGVMVAWAALERLVAAQGGSDGDAVGAAESPPVSSPLSSCLQFPWAATSTTEAAALDFDAAWPLGAEPPT